jgi:hypothetical protein
MVETGCFQAMGQLLAFSLYSPAALLRQLVAVDHVVVRGVERREEHVPNRGQELVVPRGVAAQVEFGQSTFWKCMPDLTGLYLARIASADCFSRVKDHVLKPGAFKL